MDSPSFEHKGLEADMKVLAMEIKRNQELKDTKNAEGLSVVKEAIRAFPRLEQAESNGIPTPPALAQSTGPLPAYAQSAPAAVKLEIEYLLDIAFRKGLGAALAESEKSSNFVQDAFHDALAGRLYPELQKQGVVK
jgi:hypothetical protein